MGKKTGGVVHAPMISAEQNRVSYRGQVFHCTDEQTADALAEFLTELHHVTLLAISAGCGYDKARTELHDDYDYAGTLSCRIGTKRYHVLVSELAEEV